MLKYSLSKNKKIACLINMQLIQYNLKKDDLYTQIDISEEQKNNRSSTISIICTRNLKAREKGRVR